MLYTRFLKFTIVLFANYLLKVNGQEESTDNDFEISGLNSKADECSSISTSNGEYRKISPSSKYLIFRATDNPDLEFTADESSDLCNVVAQLQPAEITNLLDLESLRKHLFKTVWLGLNQRNTPGIYTESDGSPIRFQTFVGMEPSSQQEDKKCVKLVAGDNGLFSMESASCVSGNAGALCQYRKLSTCFLQSAEEIASSTEKSAEVVNLAVGSKLFVGTSQKVWNEAFETCLANGMRLITLENDDTNQELADQMKKWLIRQNMHQATQFWTAGTFESGSDPSIKELHWFMEEGTVPADEGLVSHQWAMAAGNQLEPVDQSGSNLEECMDISFEDMESASAGAPNWRASNCLIPKYFICEKVPIGVSKEAIKQIIDAQIKESGNFTEGGLVARSMAEEAEPCGEVKVDPLNFEIDITRPQTEEDIIRFLIFNVEHDLKSGDVPFQVKDEIKWKETVIDLLVKIVQKSIDTRYIDHGLLNVVKFVLLMYYNSVPVSSNTTKYQELWTNIYIRHLEECLNTTTSKMKLSGSGFEIGYYTTDSEDIISIEVPEEHADKIHNLDSSLDILWYMFSFSVASCYKLPMDKIGFASDFHVQFIADFIFDMRDKWTINVETAESENSRGLDYSLALGDFDFMQSYRNLRYLVTAAYMQNGIQELQLVRPLDMSKISSELPMPPENAKTGTILKL